jgi:hypothetical protein
MGSAQGRRVMEGHVPHGVWKISSQLQQGRRQHGAGRRRKDETGVMKKSQRAQSEHFQEGFLQQCD